MRDSALASGCDALGFAPDTAALARLSSYLDMLEKWNRAYNLTAVRLRTEMVTRHLLDSLSILSHLEGRRFIDVGTGAGLPGVPLAILRPDWDISLLDSNGKKTRFLFQVKTALGLANINIVAQRAETWHPEQAYDGVLSRAFASLPDMLANCCQMVSPAGALYAMKGPAPEQEIADIVASGFKVTVTELQVPGLGEPRTLITLRQGKCQWPG